MGRWIAIATASAVLALAGCGIDDGELAVPNAQPDRTTAPTNTTGPSADGGDAEDLLLTADDLGPDWSGTSGDALPSIPLCTETAAVDPADHAQAVFGHSLSAGFLMQTVGVFASEEQARSAVAGFASDIDDCDNPVLDVEDLDLPAHGDEQEAAELRFGGSALDTTIQLVCVRVGERVTVLTRVDPIGTPTDLSDIVEAATGKL